MTEINETPEAPETPSSEPSAEQPASAEPAASPEPAPSTEPPASAEPAPGTEPPSGIQMSKEANKDARMWAMFCHLVGLAAILPVVPLFGGAIGALIIWQIKKEDFPFVDEQGKEALNFQISILIYALVSGLLIFVCIGAFLLPAVMIFDIVFLIIAAIKTNDGFHYRYPLCIRFIK